MFDFSHRISLPQFAAVSRESIIMAILWWSLFILIFHFIRKRTKLIQNFGIVTLVVLLAAMLLRAFVPLDFFFTHTISSVLYGDILHFFTETSLFALPGTEFAVTPCVILLAIWAAGTLISLIRFIQKSYALQKQLNRTAHAPLQKDQAVLADMLARKGKPRRITLYRAVVLSPLTYGYFHPKILLPSGKQYSETELRCIFEHELTHYYHRDSWIKLFVQILCCVFWWNPLAYLFQEDVNQVIELHCDAAVCARFTSEEQCDYLKTVAVAARSMAAIKRKIRLEHQAASEFASSNTQEKMQQRIHLLFAISETSKCSKRYYGVLAVLLTALLLVSYLFILKPNMVHYSELQDMSVLPISQENCYLAEYPEDCYFLIVEDPAQPDVINLISPLEGETLVQQAVEEYQLQVRPVDTDGFMEILAASGSQDPQKDYLFWAYMYFPDVLTQEELESFSVEDYLGQ